MPWFLLGMYAVGGHVGYMFARRIPESLCRGLVYLPSAGSAEIFARFAVPIFASFVWLWLCSGAVWGCEAVLLWMMLLGAEDVFVITGALYGGMTVGWIFLRLFLPQLLPLTVLYILASRAAERSLRLRLGRELPERCERLGGFGILFLLTAAAILRLLSAELFSSL